MKIAKMCEWMSGLAAYVYNQKVAGSKSIGYSAVWNVHAAVCKAIAP